MWHKTTQFLLIILVVVAVSQPLFSQTAVTFGGQYWLAQPELKGDLYEDLTVSAGHLYGPYLNIRLGKLILGGSMFFGTFNWKYEDPMSLEEPVEFSFNRNDFNYSLGIALFRRLNVFGAIKMIKLKGDNEFTYQYYDPYWGYYDITSREVTENSGMLYGGGISSALPLGRGPLFLFWSVAYLTGKMKYKYDYYEDDEVVYSEEWESDSATGITAVTVGLGFQFPSGLSFIVGYRADLESNEDEEGETRISGVMVTAAYTIR